MNSINELRSELYTELLKYSVEQMSQANADGLELSSGTLSAMSALLKHEPSEINKSEDSSKLLQDSIKALLEENKVTPNPQASDA